MITIGQGCSGRNGAAAFGRVKPCFSPVQWVTAVPIFFSGSQQFFTGTGVPTVHTG